MTAFALGIGMMLLALAGCDDGTPAHQRVVGGFPTTGRTLIAEYGCTACHEIPGVAGLHGTVGPSLAGFGRRTYIAGVVPNRPALLVDWLRDPPAIAPDTAMPSVGLDTNQARHMAAYLYTLR